MKSVDVGKNFGEEKVFFLGMCKSSLYDCEGAWEKFRRCEGQEVVNKIVGPVSNEFG